MDKQAEDTHPEGQALRDKLEAEAEKRQAECNKLEAESKISNRRPCWVIVRALSLMGLLACVAAGLPLAVLVLQGLQQPANIKDMYCGDATCYGVLGVGRAVSEQDLKKAYRERARRVHPDRNPAPDAHEKFVQVGNAYEVLSKPETRAQYDYYLDHPQDEVRNRLYKAQTDYRTKSGVSVGQVVWSCFLGGLLLYYFCKPLYDKLAYFLWRKWHGVPDKFDPKRRQQFLKRFEKPGQ